MAAVIYSLCMATALACAVLLLRGYVRHRHRILFWSGMCFVLLSLNNVLLVIDKLLFAAEDMPFLYSLRLWAALLALLLLLYGLIYEKE